MNRNDWKLELTIEFRWMREIFYFVPTIVYYPWKYRYIGFPAVSIHWLGFCVEFGKWKSADNTELLD